MKKTISMLQSRWREYLIEVVVIILGILLALALNNWNDRKKQKAEELTILRTLSKEFEGNITEISRILTSHQGNIDQLGVTLELLKNQHKNTDSRDLIQNIKAAVYGNTYNPMFGVVHSLLNSDRINLISNENLKYSLARLPGMVADYTEEEELVLKVVFEIILPEVLALDPEAERIDNLTLLNTLEQMIPNIQNMMEEGETLRGEMTRIAKVLEKEVNN